VKLIPKKVASYFKPGKEFRDSPNYYLLECLLKNKLDSHLKNSLQTNIKKKGMKNSIKAG
jgi:hypothetical protein